MNTRNLKPHLFPVACESAAVPDGPLTAAFPVAGEERVAADGEITVFLASQAPRTLSCDEFDLSSSKILVSDETGKIIEFGEDFNYAPFLHYKSFQRHILIPAGGMAICMSRTAGKALTFYDLARENAEFSHCTTGCFTDLKATYAGSTLTMAFRPASPLPEPATDFLFVGNSGTYVYNIPAIFRNMARAVGKNVNVDYCTIGGAWLYQYADETDYRGKKLRDMLAKKKYDFVVFHDNSSAQAEKIRQALTILIPLARQAGASPMLYMRYVSGSRCGEFYEWTKGIYNCYTEEGRKYGIPVAPAAGAFYNCVAEHPEIDLYAEDRDHHSKAGAYLIASVCLEAFLHVSPVGNGFYSGVDPAVEKILQEIALRSCREAPDSFSQKKITLDLPPSPVPVPFSHPPYNREPAGKDASSQRSFPVDCAIENPAIAVGEPMTGTFPVAGEERVAADGEITVFLASQAPRTLSCDEFDLSRSKILVSDETGKIVEFGEDFSYAPFRHYKSFQRHILIPAGGMAICLSRTAGKALTFYDLARENTEFSHCTMGCFTDLKATYAGSTLTMAFRPASPLPEPATDFLFVGNSGTNVYNIPTVFRNMARAAGKNVNVDYCTIGGAWLYQYADETDDRGKKLRDMLAKKKYDFVVFQDYSKAPAEKFRQALAVLVPLVRQAGASPMLYMRYLGGYLCDEFYERSKGLFNCYAEAGKTYGIPVAPATVAYYNCTVKHPEIDLYAEDRSHQSKAGAYLIAGVFLEAFLHVNPVGNGFWSCLNSSTEKVLQKVAFQACQERSESFPEKKITLDLSPNPVPVPFSHPPYVREPMGNDASCPRSFPVDCAIENPAIAVDKPMAGTFAVAGEDRAAADGEITVFRATTADREISCDEYDLTRNKVLVANGKGRIVEFGKCFYFNPLRKYASFQRHIHIPANGMAICLSETAGKALEFFDLARENAYFSSSTTTCFTDLKASYDGGVLTLSYRPAPPHPEPPIDFLFVGNSATFVHNTPTIFRNMARAAGKNVNVDYCMFGGARLLQYADEKNERGEKLRDMLAKKKYDFIVFHDAGRAPAEDTHRALTTLIPLARQAGGAPLLYMRYSDMVSRGDFYERAIDHFNCYSSAGGMYGIPVAPSALAYYNCTAEHPEITLYAEDLDHHSKAGAYLNACVFLQTFLHIDPVGNKFRSGVDPEVEKILQGIALRTCQEITDQFPEKEITLDLSRPITAP